MNYTNGIHLIVPNFWYYYWDKSQSHGWFPAHIGEGVLWPRHLHTVQGWDDGWICLKMEHHNKTHREHDNKVLTDYDKPWEHDDTPCENYDYTMWKFMINIDKMMIIIDKTHDF